MFGPWQATPIVVDGVMYLSQRPNDIVALDARTGDLLWKASPGSQIVNGPITYEVDGRQHVAVIAGHALTAFALRD